MNAGASSRKPPQVENFAAQLQRELYGCDEPAKAGPLPKIATSEAGEPHVTEASRTLVGLALSGGGMRSATFNLGILQGLRRCGILARLNYLSTVSGGGYIGGFWSAWRHHLATTKRIPSAFPGDESVKGDIPAGDEPAVDHLRRHSNFLAPNAARGDRVKLALSYVGTALPTFLIANLLLAGGAAFALALKLFIEGHSCCIPLLEHLAPLHLAPLVPGFGLMALLLLLLPLQIGKDQTPGQDQITRGVFSLAAVALFFGLVSTVTQNLRQLVDAVEVSAGLAALLSWWFTRQRHRVLVASIRDLGRDKQPAAGPGLAVKVAPLVATFRGTCALYSLFSRGLDMLGGDTFTACVLGAALGGSGLAWAWLLRPELVSQHEFYRQRISRAFLSAARRNRHARGATVGKPTASVPGDDPPLTELSKSQFAATPGLPLHLICCTANDLAGDSLDNLGYGGRSATLSCHGISIRGQHHPWKAAEEMRLSSALTASAAAFNSQMGRVSAKLNPTVSFLMCALNLRLGLWAPNPLAAKPGCGHRGLFLREMFSRTNLGKDSQSHLSDGGHFENLGLYELIRRQCRYIIVCDADTDPRAISTNLGGAIRRVRADFGVEIEIDTCPLETDERGYARQHVVTGRIRYGRGFTGILYYIRANLTGDEPRDILHYRGDHPAFPYESTADQFYDEAQWESYRMLGEHIAREAFAFLKPMGKPQPGVEETFWANAFNTGFWLWRQPSVAALANLAACNTRRETLAKEMEQGAPASLYFALFPEARSALSKQDGAKEVPGDLAEEFKWLHRAVIFMEGVWRDLEFGKHDRYPAYNGWTNTFRRWTGVPAFGLVWPVLRTTLDYDFVLFIEQRIGLPNSERKIVITKRRAKGRESASTYNVEFKCEVMAQTPHVARSVRKYMFPIGNLELSVRKDVARWNAEDFKTSALLRGVGYGRECLDELIAILVAATNKKSRNSLFRANRFEVAIPAKGEFSISGTIGLYQELGFIPIPDASCPIRSTTYYRLVVPSVPLLPPIMLPLLV